MQKIVSGLAVGLFLLVIVLVLLLQWGDDGAVLISDDSETLGIVANVLIVAIIASAVTLVTKGFISGYGELVEKLTSNVMLQDAIEENYLALPPLPKHTIDMLVDLVGSVADMTEDMAVDKLAKYLTDATDGVPRASPTGAPISMS